VLGWFHKPVVPRRYHYHDIGTVIQLQTGELTVGRNNFFMAQWRYRLRNALCLAGVCALFSVAFAQLAYDTLLFTISLDSDTTVRSLFVCREPGRIRKTLSGPLVMKDNTLLFYSENGYLLYNQKGSIVDSHSVFHENRGLSPDSPKRLHLLFPVNTETILYYKKEQANEYPVTLFEKKLFKKRLRTLKDKGCAYFKDLDKGQLFNFAHNTITDDMVSIYFAQPYLIGYTSLTKGNRWWTLDKFYSFSSPLINEKNGVFCSFFPGITEGDGTRNKQLVNPIQIFKRDEQWYYTGIQANVGYTDESYPQTFFICDAAGNILYADAMLKQINRDAIIGEDAETYYTVKKVEQYVFQPSVDTRGNVYYGIINYVKKYLKVKKRGYYVYTPVPTGPNLAHLIDIEKSIAYTPVSLSCNNRIPGGKTIPAVTVLDNRGRRINAQVRHLTKNGYIVRIYRKAYRDIERKLARSRAKIPGRVKPIKDSLSGVSTISCPYALALSGPRGIIRSFSYPPGVEVLCARVIAVRKTEVVVVRVDCREFAEILLFKTDGTFVNRFIFNKQYYTERKDILVATDKSPLIELDYETGKDKETFFKWERRVGH